MSSGNNMIRGLLELQENVMSSRLAEIRVRFQQAGDKGDAAEAAVREFIAENISSRFSVGNGEVIDSFGGRSKQCDVVIATDDQPFHSAGADPGLFLVEGVFASGEVKAQLTTGQLDDAIKKGEAMKSLQKFQVAGAQVFASPSDHARWVTGPPPFFVFGFESDIATTTLLNRLAGASDPAAVDAVFVLGRGAAVNFGDGQGSRRLRLADDTDAVGWAWVEGNPCLLELLAWLHALPHVEHQGAMLVRYLTQAAAEGGGSLVAFPQLGAAQDESAARSGPPR